MKRIIGLGLVCGLLLGNVSFAYNTPVRGFTDAGKIIADAPGDAGENGAEMVADGSGGSYLAWFSNQTGTANCIFAQRINSAGTPLWSPATGVQVSSVSSQSIVLTPYADQNGNSGLFIAWQSYDNETGMSRNYVQKLTSAGVPAWSSPVAVAPNQTYQEIPQIIADSQGNCLAVWSDSTATSGYPKIFAQKISADGARQWTDSAKRIDSSTSSAGSPLLCSDGGDGAIIAWNDYRNGNYDIYAQRVTSSGQLGSQLPIDNNSWGGDRAIFSGDSYSQYIANILADGSGGAIITWTYQDMADSWHNKLYAQKVTSIGSLPWAGAAPFVTVVGGTYSIYDPQIATDGSGGALLVYSENTASPPMNMYAQRIKSDGVLHWVTPPGLPLTNNGYIKYAPKLVADGAGSAIATWYEDPLGDYKYNIRSAKFTFYNTTSGGTDWTADICSADGEQSNPRICSGGANNSALIAWQDYRVTTGDIYAQKISSGTVQWASNGLRVTTATAPCSQDQPVMGGDKVVAWRDARAGAQDLYIQKFAANGDRLWGTDGKAIITNALLNLSNSSRSLGGVCQTGNNYAVVWSEDRTGMGIYNIYGQLFDDNGNRLGPVGGVAIANSTSYTKTQPSVAPDGSGGIVVVWKNAPAMLFDFSRLSNSLYASTTLSDHSILLAADTLPTQYLVSAKRISSSGSFVWSSAAASNAAGFGLPLSAYGSNVIQGSPAIANVGNGSAVVAWQDNRNDYYNNVSDIYGQKVSIGDGSLQWNSVGEAICTATGTQINPCVGSLGDGNAVIGWSDARAGRTPPSLPIDASSVKTFGTTGGDLVQAALYDLYAQKLACSGAAPVAQWTANGLPVVIESDSKSLENPKVALDSDVNAIFAFLNRNYETILGDLQVQALDPAGQKLLAAPFAAATSTSVDKYSPGVISTSLGNAYVCWNNAVNERILAQAAKAQAVPAKSSTVKASTVKAAKEVVIGSSTSSDVYIQDLTGFVTTTTVSTSTTTTTGTTTTTILTLVPTVDRVGQPMTIGATVITAKSNTLHGSNILPGATIVFTNSKTGYKMTARNVVAASDYASATFFLDLPVTDANTIGYYDVQVTNPNGSSYTKSKAFLFEMRESFLFFPTTVKASSLRAATPANQPRIAYTLAEDKPIDIYVYDVRNMRVLYHRKFAAGTVGARMGYNEVIWDGQMDAGGSIANGSYVLQGFSSGKMIGQTYFVVLE